MEKNNKKIITVYELNEIPMSKPYTEFLNDEVYNSYFNSSNEENPIKKTYNQDNLKKAKITHSKNKKFRPVFKDTYEKGWENEILSPSVNKKNERIQTKQTKRINHKKQNEKSNTLSFNEKQQTYLDLFKEKGNLSKKTKKKTKNPSLLTSIYTVTNKTKNLK